MVDSHYSTREKGVHAARKHHRKADKETPTTDRRAEMTPKPQTKPRTRTEHEEHREEKKYGRKRSSHNE